MKVKVGNGKAIILSTGAAFYLSASVFEPESNATNQQIVNIAICDDHPDTTGDKISDNNCLPTVVFKYLGKF